MAAALRAAEGGVYFFQILRGGVFSKFFPARGVYPPYPLLFPTPDVTHLLYICMSITIYMAVICAQHLPTIRRPQEQRLYEILSSHYVIAYLAFQIIL